MISLNTNLSSLIAQTSLKSSTQLLNQAVERMSTGYKINHAKDNAANYSISTNMNTQLSAYDVAADNVAMGMDLVTTASDIISMMQDKASRLHALSTQARNGTYGAQSLDAINSEVGAIMAEITRLYMTSEYNGLSLFNRQEYTIAPHLPRAGPSGFIDETALTNTEPPTAKAEYNGFIEDPVTYEQSYVDGLTAVSSVVQADGFTESEYKVASVEDLVALANLTNAGVDTTGVTFILAKDLDLGAYCAEEITKGNGGWTPIGNNTYRFKGTFDGNGHTIRNLKIDRGANYQGLFGNTSAAVFLNISLENASVKGTKYVGSLLGVLNENSKITNSYVINSSIYGEQCVGGFIGESYANSVVDYCYTKYLNITGINTHTGGLIGRNYYTVSNCFSVFTKVNGTSYTGGLIGDSIGNVTNCYAAGNINGQSYVGGLVGFSFSSITNCYATGDVESTISYTGGLVGYTSGEITNCYATGDVCGTSQIGGLAGFSSSKIDNGYASGNITGTESVGGLVGSTSSSLINNSYATGNVSGIDRIGGLVGYHYNSSLIYNCYAMGNVSGDSFVGGLVGRAYRISGTSTISDCVSYSTVSGNDLNSMGSFIGGLINTTDGINFGTLNITNCQSIEQDMKDIGGCYKHASSTYTLLSGYDMTTMLAGITDVELKNIMTSLQVGINSNNSNQINFDTNFDLEMPDFNGDIASDSSLAMINGFLDLLSEKSTMLGAVENRLNSAMDSIEVNISNLTSSLSTIRDADMAKESASYIQQQILQEASATLLATANQSPAIALQLI